MRKTSPNGILLPEHLAPERQKFVGEKKKKEGEIKRGNLKLSNVIMFYYKV